MHGRLGALDAEVHEVGAAVDETDEVFGPRLDERLGVGEHGP